MANYKDHNGDRQEVDLRGPEIYKAAADAGLSLRQHINKNHPTAEGSPDAFSQMCVAAGLRFKADDENGIPAVSMRDMMDGKMDAGTNQTGGTSTTSPMIPDSKILFPAALLEAIETALSVNRPEAVNAFESLVGYRKTIASDRYERAYIDYGGKSGPEDSQFQRVAQNARPPVMLSITASDVTQTIPTTSIGMEMSHKALSETSLDLVALTMTRFTQIADYNEWVGYMLTLLQGDPDGIATPIDTATSALAQVKADTYDAGITAAGELSQKAWLKFLWADSMEMSKSHLVTDENAVMAMDTRTDRPTNVMNDSVDRLDTPFKVIYPSAGKTLDTIVMPSDAGWPANTLMSLDKNFAVAKITSSSLDYQAVEDSLMRRSKMFRYDRGFILHRLFADAFKVLSLTTT